MILKQKASKRLLSLFLAVMMCLMILPTSALAASEVGLETEETQAEGTIISSENEDTEATEEIAEPEETLTMCNCGTDDVAIHATTCAVYAAPETPECFCVEKCTEVNVWCDICGFDATACEGGKDTAAVYLEVGDTFVADFKGISYKFTVLSDSTVELTGLAGEDSPTELSLKGSVTDGNGRSYAITAVGEYAFMYCETLTKLDFGIIGSTVKTIGDHAFEGCTSLVEVSLQLSAVTHIGISAFVNCTALKTCWLNNSNDLQQIGAGAFLNCTSLESLNLTNTKVTHIGAQAFMGCTSLTSAELSYLKEGSLTLGDGVFAYCEKLTNVSFPNYLTEIPTSTFMDCVALSNIKIPENVTIIGNSVFKDCTNLKRVEYASGEAPVYLTNGGVEGSFSDVFPSHLHELIVVDGKGDGAYAAGETVTLSYTGAGEFVGWEVTSGTATIDGNTLTMGSAHSTVTPVLKPYTVTVTESENGTVTADKDTAIKDETVTLTVTPDEGYVLESLTVGGTDVTEQVVDNTYTFNMPAEDVTVTATFKAVTTYDLWVGGTQVTSGNASDVLGDGTVSYNPETYTLTLNNATITAANVNAGGMTVCAGICVSGDSLNIKLIGTNTINEGTGTGDVTEAAGIYSHVSLTISGGTLYATAGNALGSYGITTASQSITITDATVITKGSKDNTQSWGISGAPVIISGNSHVIAEGSFYSGNCTVADGTVYYTRTSADGTFTQGDRLDLVSPYREIITAAHLGDYTQNDDTHTKSCTCSLETVVESGNCSGGTATCTDKAVCTVCGESYGEEPTGHSTTAEGDKAATCTAKAYCSVCEKEYGDFAPNNHTSEEFTYTDNKDSATHTKAYKCCNATVDATENHSLTYSTSGDTITATCSANCGYSETATITAAGKTYDESAVTATVAYSGDWPGDDLEITYAQDGETLTEAPKDAGTYTASITYENVTASVDFTIAPRDISSSATSTTSVGEYRNSGYTADDIKNSIRVFLDGNTLAYGTDYNFILPVNPMKELGRHTITIQGIGNYTGEITTTFDISKPKPTVTTSPARIEGLQYTGGAQALITAGAAEGGTMQYRPDDSNEYSVEIPTATEVGRYTVWWRVLGDENHADKSDTSIYVTISKADAKTVSGDISVANGYANTYLIDLSQYGPFSGTWGSNASYTLGEVNITDGYYDDGAVIVDGKLSLPIKAVEVAEEGTIGTITVTITSPNFDDSTLTLNVYRKNKQVVDASITLNVSDITYGADPAPSYSFSGASSGTPVWTLTYSNDSGANWHTLDELLVGGNLPAGDYIVKAHYEDDTQTGEATDDFKVNKVDPTVNRTPTAKTLTYNGNPQELVNGGTATGGTMVYCLTEDGQFSETIPTGTNAGEYTVWYYVQGDGNHKDSEKASVEVTIAPAAIISVTITWTDMSFTYNKGTWNTETLKWDGGGWVADDGCGTVTVENTGDVDINAEFTVNITDADYTSLSVGFTVDGTALTDNKLKIPVSESKTVSVTLTGDEPEAYIEDKKTIGQITIVLSTE